MTQAVLAFDQHAQEYDRWFDAHAPLYQSEVNALRRFIPQTGQGIEIGVGTGRFSVPLGIRLGVEPSRAMAHVAHQRGIAVCQAIGEQLPFGQHQFDASDKFYRAARFYSAADIADRVRQTGFGAMHFGQTIFGLPGDAPAIQPMREGYGEGAFAVLSAKKD